MIEVIKRMSNGNIIVRAENLGALNEMTPKSYYNVEFSILENNIIFEEGLATVEFIGNIKNFIGEEIGGVAHVILENISLEKDSYPERDFFVRSVIKEVSPKHIQKLLRD